MTQPIVQVIYASSAAVPFEDEALVELLRRARTTNRSVGVTGMLLYEGGSFLQVLEGPTAAVDALYARIAQDPRHTDTVLLFRGEVEDRHFDEWAMGFARPTQEARMVLPGWSEFLQSGFRGDAEDSAARAQKLLFAFRDGRFRR